MEAEDVIMKRVAAVLLVAAMATSCGHPLIPESVLAPQKAQVTSPEPAIIGATGPVLGVNLYSPRNYTAAQVETDGKRMLSYIRNILRAGAVDIVWNFYSPGYRSDAVEATSASLSAASVAILTRIAQQDHLLVEYRPLIMVEHVTNPWEGRISPADPALWFANYYNLERPYLQDAQRYHINEFVAATEMKALNGSPLWGGFFVKISQVYSGAVSYAAHQADYFPPGTRLLPVKYLGMDMYRSLALPSWASPAQVTAAYEAYFKDVPESVLRRTSIDETGIAARTGAYQAPSYLGIPGTLDEALQANWFIAACNTVKKYEMRAVFFWKVDLADYPLTHPAHSLSTFEGKQGAKAITECASALSN